MARPRALITGASSGIGADFARLLAPDHDLILVARDAERLRSTASALSERWKGSVEVIVADLSASDDLERVTARLGDGSKPVDLLVNNAGFGTYGVFAALPIEDEVRQIALNVEAVVRLTRAVLPGQIDRGRGAVLNVASLGAFQPGPQCATYVATKAFVLSFTESIAEELRGTGVRAVVLCPGFTRTEFQARSGMTASAVPEAAWMSSEAVVQAALADLQRGKVVSIPGLQNKVLASGIRLLPRSVVRRVAGMVTSRL